MKIDQQFLYPPVITKTSTQAVPPQTVNGRSKAKQETNFANVLQEKLARQPLKFSAHALQRLQERRIELQPHEVEKLAQAVQKAEAKGARSTLLLYQDMAFVASVKNNTIITAVNGDNLKDHVFTNIDSAVMVK